MVSQNSRTQGQTRGKARFRGREQGLWLTYAMRPDDATRDRLIEWYMPLVTHIAHRMAARIPPNLVDVDDLIQEGVIGLTQAIRSWDIEKMSASLRYGAYVSRRIQGNMLDALRRLDWCPRAVRAAIRKLERVDPQDDTAIRTIAESAGLNCSEARILMGGHESVLKDRHHTYLDLSLEDAVER